jgi:hypothetical protein
MALLFVFTTNKFYRFLMPKPDPAQTVQIYRHNGVLIFQRERHCLLWTGKQTKGGRHLF